MAIFNPRKRLAVFLAIFLIVFPPVLQASSATSSESEPAQQAQGVTIFSLFGSRSRNTEDRPALAPSSATRPQTSRYSTNRRTQTARADGIRYDARLIRAAQIAESRARARSINRCWRYVKLALVDAEVVDYYPKTTYAKQAVQELPNHGFMRIPVSDPYSAPVGAVLVYGGRGPGHVEFRTESGFVSDFASDRPSSRPLIGVFVKPVDRPTRNNVRVSTNGRSSG